MSNEDLVLTGILRSIYLACSTYVKPCAPHRLSLYGDYERCVESAIASLPSAATLYRRMEEVFRGNRTLQELGLGQLLGEALRSSADVVGHDYDISASLSTVMMGLFSAVYRQRSVSLSELRSVVRDALLSAGVNEAIEFIKSTRNIGGALLLLVDEIGLSEASVRVEGLSLFEVFMRLGEKSPELRAVIDIDTAVRIYSIVRKCVEDGVDVNTCAVLAHLEVAKEHVRVGELREIIEKIRSTRSSVKALRELISLDQALRRRGVKLRWIVAPMAYSFNELLSKGVI